MKLWTFPLLRALAYLKRIARAQERSAAALEAMAEGNRAEERPKPKLAEVFAPTTEEMNRMWRDEHAFEEESWR